MIFPCKCTRIFKGTKNNNRTMRAGGSCFGSEVIIGLKIFVLVAGPLRACGTRVCDEVHTLE